MKHIKLFENFKINEQEEQDLCKYYTEKSKDSGYENFWNSLRKMSKEDRDKSLEEMRVWIKSILDEVKKEYIEWYQKPETKEKFSKQEESVRVKLVRDFIPKVLLRILHFQKDNSILSKSWGFFNRKEPNAINLNLYNFFNGKKEGNKSVKDTIKHEMAHAIDYFFSSNGVRTYIATHPPNMSQEEYMEIYLINDRDQFARLNVLRGIIGAGPVDSGKELLEKFMLKVKSGKITSESFVFSRGLDQKRGIYALVMTKKPREGEKGKAPLDVAKKVYSHMHNKNAIMVDGKENYNIEQLFSNFARINGDTIMVNMNDIASLNSTSKAMN